MNRKLTAKDYQSMFNIGYSTARRWIAEDRKRFECKNLCFSHIKGYYSLDVSDLT